ncbi:MAG TPA: prefoldin subunit alpha [Candidatus Nanoarchaeia archaeon]|nr:prefoldin subunit alpha [Candidatus Nanoarchaeia archaeon]
MNEAVQEKYFEFQMLQQQVEQLRQQQAMVERQLQELSNLKDSLSGVVVAKKGVEVLVPLGVGVFVRASLLKNDEVIMNVGSKMVVVKSVADAQKVVDKQVVEAKIAVEELQGHGVKMGARMQALQEELQVMVEEQQKSHKDHKH